MPTLSLKASFRGGPLDKRFKSAAGETQQCEGQRRVRIKSEEPRRRSFFRLVEAEVMTRAWPSGAEFDNSARLLELASGELMAALRYEKGAILGICQSVCT